ncbi:tautomerase family protein [Rhizobium skierniewicense]|uniref:tautomerase family protein n=1 Tax=Rhizobium skierniewicense TaxID=984260 RepID=UPI0015749F7A|nr:hypothetical protein [Rhizobium skierniewicense]NTF31225.1 hypothetical protein [Rhizobium skierniewicense]
MPYAKLILGADVSLPDLDAVAAKLTDLISLELNKTYDLTAVSVEMSKTPVWLVGGTRSSIAAHLEVYVTANTNTAEQKAQFIASAMTYLRSVIPQLPVASYIVIHELPGSNWGYDGWTQAQRSKQAHNLA